MVGGEHVNNLRVEAEVITNSRELLANSAQRGRDGRKKRRRNARTEGEGVPAKTPGIPTISGLRTNSSTTGTSMTATIHLHAY